MVARQSAIGAVTSAPRPCPSRRRLGAGFFRRDAGPTRAGEGPATDSPRGSRFALIATILFTASASAAPPAAGRYLRQLDETSWMLRAEALHYLAEHKIGAALEPIRALAEAETNKPWTRGRALIALCQIEPGERPPELLLDFAAAAKPELREAAAEALELYADISARGLATRLLADTEVGVRMRAAATYAKIHGAVAWPIIDPLTREPAPGVLPIAARALAYVGSGEAIARLLDFAVTPDHSKANEIVRRLTDIPNTKLIPVYLAMLEALDEGGMAYPALISALANQDRAAVVAALADTLAKGNERSTFMAARVITVLVQEPELGTPLREAIAKANDFATREAGLVALGCKEMEPDSHRDFFASHLEHDDPILRTLAIRCLAHCPATNLFDALKEIIDDDDRAVRSSALSALLRTPVGQAPSGQLVTYLEPALVDTDEETRRLAFEVLAYAGSKDDFQPALAMLGDALQGTNAQRREAVAAALGSIAPEDGIAPVARRQGYVANWMVVGTFLNEKEHTGFAKTFPPEEGQIDFEATYPSTYVWALEGHRKEDQPIERDVTWGEASVDRTDGRLRLAPLLPPPGSFAVAYAVSDFNVPAERDVFLAIDGDDAFRVWLNGEKIADAVAPHQHRKPCVVTEPKLAVKLNAGPNRLLVKTANIDTDWWVRLRFTDSNDKPVEVRK